MIFKLDEIKSIVQEMKPFVASTRVQILNNLCFTGTHVIGFNLVHGCIDCFATPEPFLVPFDEFSVFVNAAKKDIDVTLTPGALELKSGAMKAALSLEPFEDYPDLSIIQEMSVAGNPFIFDSDNGTVFISALNHCAPFVARHAALLELSCIHVSNGLVEATDGIRIAREMIPLDTPYNFLIHPQFAKVLSKFKLASMVYDKSTLVFNGKDGQVLFGTLIEGEYPNIGKFFPEKKKFIQFPREELKEALTTVGDFTGETSYESRCTLELGDVITLQYEGNTAKLTNVLDFGKKLPKGKFTLNPYHLAVLLDNCTKFSIVDDNALYGEAESFKCLISLFSE